MIGVPFPGPISQVSSASSLTRTPSPRYVLLGVLNRRHMMALSPVETAAGILIGVTCAYLVFSTDSKQIPNACIAAHLAPDALPSRLGAGADEPDSE